MRNTRKRGLLPWSMRDDTTSRRVMLKKLEEAQARLCEQKEDIRKRLALRSEKDPPLPAAFGFAEDCWMQAGGPAHITLNDLVDERSRCISRRA